MRRMAAEWVRTHESMPAKGFDVVILIGNHLVGVSQKIFYQKFDEALSSFWKDVS